MIARICFSFTFMMMVALVPAIAERPVAMDAATDRLRQLRADVEYLASEELRGRSVADETIHVAADYIAQRMTSIGLDTTVIDGTPYQEVPILVGAEAGLAENNRVVLQPNQGKPILATLGEGMNPMSIGSDLGQVTGPLVFVGYGITAPKFGYDDYAGIDAKGATVIMLRKEPQSADPNSRFNGVETTRHAFFTTKIENAIRHGASAVLLVNDRASIGQSERDVRQRIDAELRRKRRNEKQIESLPAEAVNTRQKLAERITGIDSMVASINQELKLAQRGVLEIAEAGPRPTNKDSIPVVSLARDLVDEALLRSSGRSLVDIEEQIDATLTPQSHVFSDLTATLRVELKPTTCKSSNVIGVLAGRGPLAAETIVVGAHYDHVGMGGQGSLAPGTIAVHNGADDNASGIATMLAIADQMGQRLASVATHRRIVFIAFTGEERGLLGSKFYTRHPRYPLESTVAMINLDMVGRVRDNELTVYGTGSGDLMDEIIEHANRRTQFSLFKVPSGYGPSDQQSFYELGVPVLFFFTGLHNDYHRPSDDFDKIDFGGMTRITDITSDATFELAIRPERPRYAETEKSVQVRRQLTAFLGVSLSARGDHVVLSGLSAGGPAEKGGVKIGDQLAKLADQNIRQPSDVLQWLRSRSPGDEVAVEVIRQGQRIEVTVQLMPRP